MEKVLKESRLARENALKKETSEVLYCTSQLIEEVFFCFRLDPLYVGSAKLL